MNKKAIQLDLFHPQSLNPTYEIKRALRLSLSKTHLSRDQVVDAMNKVASSEGMRKNISKATLDNWTKDSDPDRLPSLPWLTIFCCVLNDADPVATIIRTLGYDLIDERRKALLVWAEAELNRKKAIKRAKNALAIAEEF
ncbi:hypothetical protein ACFL0H_06030 [Thermodesulfobacteriota bacterium]